MMLRVVRKLGAFTSHPMLEHFEICEGQHTKATAKMTIPSPSSVHFRYGRGRGSGTRFIRTWPISIAISGRPIVIAVRAFADAGCRYLQLDEVNFAYLCDPKLREQVADRGDDPDKLPSIYAAHDQRCHIGYLQPT